MTLKASIHAGSRGLSGATTYHELQEKLEFLRTRCSDEVVNKYNEAENFLGAVKLLFNQA